MDTRADVVIVSSYGRGNWLAFELRTLGLEVILVDVSESTGRQTPEDVEGPFGYFQATQLTPSQRARLDSEDYADVIEDGFVVWLKSGPIDLRGPQAQELLARHKISAEAKSYVEKYDQLTEKNRSELTRKMNHDTFEKTWFAQLAHSLGCPVAMSANKFLDEGRPLPLFSPYSVRRVSRLGHEKSLTWLQEKGVRVLQKAKISDVALRGAEMLNIEVSSQWSGVLSADQFIWCLTSEETQHFSKEFVGDFFSNGVLRPEWVWLRFRFEITGEQLVSTLPVRFLVIEDESLPWSHANMMWVQKTPSSGLFDVWMRAPAVHRFQRSYHEKLATDAAQILSSRLPGAELKINEYPQEHQYDEAVLGPARHQMYSAKSWHKHSVRRFKNIHFDGPELWPMLDWNGQFEFQNKILANLKIWKTDRDLRLEKLRAKAALSTKHDTTGGPPT